MMRALVIDLALPRAAYTLVGSRIRHDAGWHRVGRFSPGLLRHREDEPEPRLPGPGWVLVAPTLAGVCGSDMKLLKMGMSRVLGAYAPQQRAIPGHEVVGTVVAAGPGVTRVSEGDRVLLDPYVGCVLKGLAPCPPCSEGLVHLCRNIDRAGSLCVGQGQGFSPVLGGGWAERLAAHESQLTPVPDVAETRAVLAEPASIALHAALRWRREGDRVVVVGPGTIGLLTTAALRRLHPDLDITMVSAGAFGADRARAAGATRVVQQPADNVLAEVSQLVGARRLHARTVRLPVLDGGVDAVFDCVASTETLDLGLRLLRARGTYVMLGTAGAQPHDWSLVWWRELTILGSYGFDREPALGGRRTQEVVGEWLADPSYAVDGLVTHRFPLESFAEAFETAMAGPRAGAVKVVFAPQRAA